MQTHWGKWDTTNADTKPDTKQCLQFDPGWHTGHFLLNWHLPPLRPFVPPPTPISSIMHSSSATARFHRHPHNTHRHTNTTDSLLVACEDSGSARDSKRVIPRRKQREEASSLRHLRRRTSISFWFFYQSGTLHTYILYTHTCNSNPKPATHTCSNTLIIQQIQRRRRRVSCVWCSEKQTPMDGSLNSEAPNTINTTVQQTEIIL